MRRLPLTLITFFTVILSCTTETPRQVTDTSTSVTASDSAASTADAASSPPSQPDKVVKSIGLVSGEQAGDIDYAWSGTGDSRSMNVKIVNKTDREWLVDVEVGTKLEPSNEAAQSMIVTSEIHVKLHPHDSQKVEVEVACLDISKDPPDSSDDTWKVTVSSRLAAFIACVNRDNPAAVQEALWYFRGATREQWIEYFTKYDGKTQSEAEQAADSIESEIGDLVRKCTP